MQSRSVNFAILFLFLPVFLLSFITCIQNTNNELQANNRSKVDGIDHAMGFKVEIHDEYRIIRVFDPWQGARNITFKYILVDSEKELPDPLPEGMLVRTPVRSVICLSTTHIAMLEFISASEEIIAVSGSRYIYSQQIRQRIAHGNLPDIGYDGNLDYELILKLQPDIVFAYGVGDEASSFISRLQSLGINVVVIGEYLEQSPLAQAEWVIFVANFFNKQDLAKKKFRIVEDEYNKLVEKTLQIVERPLVLTGLPWRDSWFVPGGQSLFATLIADAGGQYIWANNSGRENFPVNMEVVFSEAERADFWINTGTALSANDIKNTDIRLTGLRPFRDKTVYNNNARVGEAGGNDFWESGIVNPHLILKDLIHVLHPDLIESHQYIYYRKL